MQAMETLFGYINAGNARTQTELAAKDAEIAAIKKELETQAGVHQALMASQEEMYSSRCKDLVRVMRLLGELQEGLSVQVNILCSYILRIYDNMQYRNI